MSISSKRKPSALDFTMSQLFSGTVTLSRESGGIRGGPGQSSWSRGSRFDSKTNPMRLGRHSPDGAAFFKANDMNAGRDGKEYSMAPRLDKDNTRASRQTPGPASYSPIASAAKRSSPLEGPEYCNITMKQRTKTAADLNRDGNVNVGPPSYDAYKKLGAEAPAFTMASACKPKERPLSPPKPIVEDEEGMKPEDVNSLRHSNQGTFAKHKRFTASEMSQSPNGPGYYRPNRLYDTINKGPSTSLGAGQRVDFGRLTQSPGPAAYKMTSPIPQPVLLSWDISGKAFLKMKRERMLKQQKANTESPKTLAAQCPVTPAAVAATM